ncbi:MAG: hypothetical protein AAFY52_07055 [Pseudomonadota bacterium]
MRCLTAASAALLIWAQAAAAAEWTFQEGWTEPLDGFETDVARVETDGFALHLYRNPGGRVMALFTWPDGVGAVVDSGAVAVLTPEGFKPKTIEARAEQGRIVEYARIEGQRLRDRLWHGEGTVPVGTLADILAAPTVRLDLNRADAGPVTATWSMEGSDLPLARALGLTLDGVPAGAEWEDRAGAAMLAAMSACQFPKLDMECVTKVTACAPNISEQRDIDGFETCVAQ